MKLNIDKSSNKLSKLSTIRAGLWKKRPNLSTCKPIVKS